MALKKKAPRKIPAVSLAFERERLLQELEVHQVELETQNRELRDAQLLLEVSRDSYAGLYAELYDFAPVGYVSVDDQGVIQEINLTAAGMLGTERTRLVGVPFHLHVVQEDLARFREHLAKLSKPDARAVTELHLACKGGSTLPVLMQSLLLYDKQKKGFLCRTTLTDITVRKRDEQALRDNEARLGAVLDTAIDGIITINERGTIESFNRAAEKLFGYSADEAIGQNVSLLMPSPDREQHDGYLSHYRHTGERRIIGIGREVVGRRKDGSTFPLDLSVSEVRLGARRIFTGLVRDITNRKQLENETAEATEAEQRRIGRDLHDGLGQHLTALELLTQTLVGKLKHAAPELVKPAQDITREIRETIRQTRLLSHSLSPMLSEADALMLALSELAASTQSISRIKCEFNCIAPVLVNDVKAATHFYRIAQEAVNNALKHSGAKRIVISLTEQNGSWSMTVRDDGHGLSAESDRHPGLGLHTMRYRAKLIGASLDVDSTRDKGVRITCTLKKPS